MYMYMYMYTYMYMYMYMYWPRGIQRALQGPERVIAVTDFGAGGCLYFCHRLLFVSPSRSETSRDELQNMVEICSLFFGSREEAL